MKDVEERNFYIQLCAALSLSVGSLERKISEDASHNQGKMPNNFGVTIPDYKRAFQAIQMFKDEYLLDYINVEQLGERDEDIDERVVERRICPSGLHQTDGCRYLQVKSRTAERSSAGRRRNEKAPIKCSAG